MPASPKYRLSVSQNFLDRKSLVNETLLGLIASSLSRAQLLESPARDSSTPLQKALMLKNTAFAAALLKHGANMNVTDQDGWTLLHTAVYDNDLSTVTLLLDHGADPNAKTALWGNRDNRPSGLNFFHKWAGTALHIAAMVASPTLVSLLLKHGADPNADTGVRYHGYYEGGHGPGALDIALDTGKFYGNRWWREPLGATMLSVAGLLVKHGADVKGEAAHLHLNEICKFKDFPALWEKLREGIGEGEGGCIMCND